MPETPANCPSQQTLINLRRGKLDAATVETLKAHVRACPACKQFVLSLSAPPAAAPTTAKAPPTAPPVAPAPQRPAAKAGAVPPGPVPPGAPVPPSVARPIAANPAAAARPMPIAPPAAPPAAAGAARPRPVAAPQTVGKVAYVKPAEEPPRHRSTRRRSSASDSRRLVGPAIIGGVLLVALIAGYVVYSVTRKPPATLAGKPSAPATTAKPGASDTPDAAADGATSTETPSTNAQPIKFNNATDTKAPATDATAKAAAAEPDVEPATTLAEPKSERPEPWGDLPPRLDGPVLNARGIGKILSQPVKSTWDATPIKEFASDLRTAYQMNVLVDDKAFEAADIEPAEKKVSWKDTKAPLEQALNTMLGQKKLEWTVNRDTLWITLKGGLDFDWYAELAAYRTAPDITEKTAPALVRQIEAIEPATWNKTGGSASVEWSGGVLFVRQLYGVQREIEKKHKQQLHWLEPAALPIAADAKFEQELAAPLSITQNGDGLDMVFAALEEARELPIGFKIPEEYKGRNLDLDRLPTGVLLEILLRPYKLTYYVDTDGVIVTTTADARKTVLTREYELTDKAPTFADSGSLVKAIEQLVEPNSWPSKGGGCEMTVSADDQKLTVVQTERGHHQLERFFGLLKAAAPKGASQGAKPAKGAAKPGEAKPEMSDDDSESAESDP